MILQVDGVTKSFGPVQALTGASFGLEQGDIVGLVGDNGAGKSTLMKIITGVHAPDQGKVLFDSKDITTLDPGQKRVLGIEMIYQDLALARQQDVASNIFLGREPTKDVLGIPYRVDRKRMETESSEILDRLGIGIPSVRYRVGNMSGGQQQTVAIARALTFSPRLVIMDEPTAALAVKEVSHVLEVIQTLRNQGITVILISHRLNDVFEVAERILVMRQGAMVADVQTSSSSQNEVVSYMVGAK